MNVSKYYHKKAILSISKTIITNKHKLYERKALDLVYTTGERHYMQKCLTPLVKASIVTFYVLAGWDGLES